MDSEDLARQGAAWLFDRGGDRYHSSAHADYVHYICPQFTHTHVNFQRVPCVDTSNPFIARDIPAAGESMVVIRFAKPKGIDFPYLLAMIGNSFMSRANTIVVPGGSMELAMQLIFTPFISRMMERRKRALGRA